LLPLRRSSRACVQRRPAADWPTLLNQRRCTLVRARLMSAPISWTSAESGTQLSTFITLPNSSLDA
jgi:hypothetical protein